VAGLVIAAGMLGVVGDLYRPASSALIADVVPRAERVKAFGLIFWAINLGYPLAGTTGGLLTAHGYWPLFAVFQAALRDRLFLAFVLLTVVYGVIYAQATVGVPLAMRSDGFRPSAYSVIAIVNGVLIVVLQPLAGPWLARFAPLRVLAAAWVTVGIGMALTGLADTPSQYGATAVVWTLGEIGAGGLMGSLVADLAPADAQGRYQAVFGFRTGFRNWWRRPPAPVFSALGPDALCWGCRCLGALCALAAVLLTPAAEHRRHDHTRGHRNQGQPVLPGHHDVRSVRRSGGPGTHPRLGAGRRDQLHRHGRRVWPRRGRGNGREGTPRAPGPHRSGDQGVLRDGRRPEYVGRLTAMDNTRGRQQPAAAEHRLHRPLPGSPTRPLHRHRRDAVRAVRPGAGREGPRHRHIHLSRRADRRGPVGRGAPGHVRFRCEQPSYSILVRGAEAAVLPTCQRYGMAAIVWGPLAGGFLTGKYRGDRPIDMRSGRPASYPRRFDPALPANVRKLEIVEELAGLAAEIGCSLPHLALAFTTAHPAVTSSIVGPRTPGQLADLLDGADRGLEDDVLDRIDEIVPPGTTINPADAGSQLPPALLDPAERRRTLTARSAR
jgi:MFS family permease